MNEPGFYKNSLQERRKLLSSYFARLSSELPPLDGLADDGRTRLETSTRKEENMIYDHVNDRWMDVRVISCDPNIKLFAGMDEDLFVEDHMDICPACNCTAFECNPVFSCTEIVDVDDLRNTVSGNSNEEPKEYVNKYLEYYEPATYTRVLKKRQNYVERPKRVLEPRAWNAHTFGIQINADGCPICAIARGCSSAVLSSHGIVPRNGTDQEPIQKVDLDFADAVYCGTSAAYNWKQRQFLPFGRLLHLPYEEYPPVHDLSRCLLMYLSDFATEMRSSIDNWTNRRQVLVKPGPCGTVSTRMSFSKAHRKALKMIAISQYVGLAVALPSTPVRGNKAEVRHFYDWSRGRKGLQEHVVDRRTTTWKGICPPCLLRCMDPGSLSYAAVTSGAPDPLLRINDDYLEDIIEQAIEAEASQTFRLFIVEPVIIKNLDRRS